jgi:cell division septum initiation protein DivIVA
MAHNLRRLRDQNLALLENVNHYAETVKSLRAAIARKDEAAVCGNASQCPSNWKDAAFTSNPITIGPMITNKELATAGFNGWESKIIKSLEERIESLEGEIKGLKNALTAEPNLRIDYTADKPQMESETAYALLKTEPTDAEINEGIAGI